MRLNRRDLILVGVLVLVGSCSPAETGGGSSIESYEPSTTSSTLQTATTTTTSTVRDTTTTSTVTGTTATTVADWDAGAALAAIDGFYSALNEGDLTAALKLLTDQSSPGSARRLTMAVEGFNAQYEYECTPGTVKGRVSCVQAVTDDLYGPAGIVNRARLTFNYHSSGRLAVGEWPPPCCPEGDALDFLIEFRVWSAEVHPELENHWHWGYPIDNKGAIPCTVYPFYSEQGAVKVSEIVPEFVAESNTWPIDSP